MFQREKERRPKDTEYMNTIIKRKTEVKFRTLKSTNGIQIYSHPQHCIFLRKCGLFTKDELKLCLSTWRS